MAADDDHPLANSDHPGVVVDTTGGQAEGLALPETSARAEEDQQSVTARHGGERKDLTRRQQPDDGRADVGKPDVIARGLADVAVSHRPAHDAGEYDVNGFDGSGGKSLYRLQILYPLLNHGRAYRREPVFAECRDDVIAKMSSETCR